MISLWNKKPPVNGSITASQYDPHGELKLTFEELGEFLKMREVHQKQRRDILWPQKELASFLAFSSSFSVLYFESSKCTSLWGVT